MIKLAQAKNVGAVHTHTHTSILYLNNDVVKTTTFICVASEIVKKAMCEIIKISKKIKYNELE